MPALKEYADTISRIAPVFLNCATLGLTVHTDYLPVAARLKQLIAEVPGKRLNPVGHG